jgi:hypothetical protein
MAATSASRTPSRSAARASDVSAWSNSSVLEGELTSEVQRLRRERDVIVIGSTSVVHTLMERSSRRVPAADLSDGAR